MRPGIPNPLNSSILCLEKALTANQDPRRSNFAVQTASLQTVFHREWHAQRESQRGKPQG